MQPKSILVTKRDLKLDKLSRFFFCSNNSNNNSRK